MAAEASTHHTLEDLPYDEDEEKAKPLRLQLSVLKAITNNFSEKQVIGSGAYGVVYKAQLGDNFIAVKLLGSLSEIEGKTFEREVDCLVRVKHRNIVGFVGYCAESHWEVVWHGAKFILAESQKRLLCFEYMRNGSLRRHLIPGEPCGLQWHVCYQIVKGMCQGLHYLHEKHIIHLDLKPDNILLDDDMVPKIADFGLSRLLGVEKSRTVTQNIRGSMGYMAPEYMLHGSITIKSDIYSLGVTIMQMLTGGHTAEPIIDNALRIWRRRLESETSQRHTPLEICYQQVKACIEISTSCTEHKPENRPVTGDIIRRLGETVASGISTSPERKDVSAQVPLRLQLSLLKDITNNFSEEQVIGSGAYGVVYKALLGDNFIAVKLLGSFSEIKDKTFEREVDCLVRVKHRNIVGFVGYCAESHVEVVWQGAKFILAESQKRLLCFEYMRNGSLRRHLIPGEPCGLQWHVCYQIVKGMCQGLHYLHEKHIIHLDLKPDNILLDDDMVPKIADFGLSRLLGVEKSRTVTQNIRGSMGYMAPEYLLHGSITIKSDIYSLGVIIMQMLTGGHTAEPPMALGIWRCRLESETSQRHTPLEIGYQQVKACIEISTSCTEHKPEKRPVTGDIIRRLGETVA